MTELTELRAEIESVDAEILALVARRVELARQAGARKRERGSATLDPGREAAIIRRAVEAGRSLGLAEEGVRALFWTLIDLCRSAQLEEQ